MWWAKHSVKCFNKDFFGPIFFCILSKIVDKHYCNCKQLQLLVEQDLIFFLCQFWYINNVWRPRRFLSDFILIFENSQSIHKNDVMMSCHPKIKACSTNTTLLWTRCVKNRRKKIFVENLHAAYNYPLLIECFDHHKFDDF